MHKKNIILLAVLLVSTFLFYRYTMDTKQTKPGTIIILNGPSASGKSSLQKSIQKQFDDFYIKVGIDNLFDAPLPEPDLSQFSKTQQLIQSTNNGQLVRSIKMFKDNEGNQIISLEVGPVGFKVIQGMHRAIAAYAQAGNNVVVDYILYDHAWLPDLIKALKGYKVYMIGVNLPLEVLEQREKSRGTSPIGHARSHYDTVHKNMNYDLELDTSKLSSDEAAAKIKEFVANNPEPKAFKSLSSYAPTAEQIQVWKQRDMEDALKGAGAKIARG